MEGEELVGWKKDGEKENSLLWRWKGSEERKERAAPNDFVVDLDPSRSPFLPVTYFSLPGKLAHSVDYLKRLINQAA